jgi:hypothetical protein
MSDIADRLMLSMVVTCCFGLARLERQCIANPVFEHASYIAHVYEWKAQIHERAAVIAWRQICDMDRRHAKSQRKKKSEKSSPKL